MQLRQRLKATGTTGQLGYGIPQKSLAAGLAREPDYIGADTTRADLARLLRAARKLDVPLLIGTAGSAGASARLEKTLAMVRDVSRRKGFTFGFCLHARGYAPPNRQASGALGPQHADRRHGASERSRG
jgi:hypothetical protein